MSWTRHNRHVLLLRERLKPLGLDVAPQKLERLLRVSHWDLDLALTALTMRPRPGWVTTIAGPLPDRPTRP